MHTRVAFVAAVLAFSVPAAGQTWTPPRTPWGDPDLALLLGEGGAPR